MSQRNDTLQAARLRLEARQMRFTPARRLVVELLSNRPGPQSAADLIAATRGVIPISSLYRTLSVLEDSAVLHRFPDQAGVAQYELAEWLTGHHHHVTCVVCGATSDVEVPTDLETTVAQTASELGRRVGFEVTGHRLDLHGVCSQCR